MEKSTSESLIDQIGPVPVLAAFIALVCWSIFSLIQFRCRNRNDQPDSIRILKWCTVISFLVSFLFLYFKSWQIEGYKNIFYSIALVAVAGFLGEFTPRANQKLEPRSFSGLYLSGLMVINVVANLGFKFLLMFTYFEGATFRSSLPRFSQTILLVSSLVLVGLFIQNLFHGWRYSLLRIVLFGVILLLTVQTNLRPWQIDRFLESLSLSQPH